MRFFMLVVKTTIHFKEASWKVNCDIKWLEAFRVSSCRPLLISVSFFTKLYNVLWEHHKFIALIGQLTYYQNLNVSTGEKTALTTQINSNWHITWLSLILIDCLYLEKTETLSGSRDILNTIELDLVHPLQYM